MQRAGRTLPLPWAHRSEDMTAYTLWARQNIGSAAPNSPLHFSAAARLFRDAATSCQQEESEPVLMKGILPARAIDELDHTLETLQTVAANTRCLGGRSFSRISSALSRNGSASSMRSIEKSVEPRLLKVEATCIALHRVDKTCIADDCMEASPDTILYSDMADKVRPHQQRYGGMDGHAVF